MSAVLFFVLRIGLAVSLYAFLGWVVYTLWRSLQHQTSLLSDRHPIPIQLSRVDSGEPTSKRFTEGLLTIGRDPGCDLSLADNTVSAHHARLSFQQGQWWVEDLHSTNGTFINDEQVTTPMVVTEGDKLRCGQITLTIVIKA